ncbi:uncharacterized protein ASPGLDRAFT_176021 [Aspergillus glaucus CBS 516.65]|uniref:Uncharacterized protein n=1 Tax=Aspergillus glaucus CBS 516.65 TaxID=1160497 RepID=A0A1L9VD72_ASPGL|nr:hypothetical protein ASPGLDRAFT_176021 [Aspergillus glaucus CBS 516.65]OJJ81835.1 hypothetical protein ASPGLDRAFT_176021 [Aspergillus glaucus CBS 516.65]
MSGLTPIRVRGRRKRVKLSHGDQNQDAKPVRGNRRGKQLLPLDASQRSLYARRKRPFISGSNWLSSQPQPQSQLDSLSQLQYQYQYQYHSHSDSQPQPKKKKRKNLSRLELLPVELLERIFLYALNVNFARSSPSLAAAVSSERVYRVLILLAFWRDPHRSPEDADWDGNGNGGSAGVARILRPLDYVPIGEDERRILQSTVFRCTWCTVHRVLKYLPGLMALSVQRLWLDAGITMDNYQQDSLNRYLESSTENNSGGAIRTFQGTKNNKHYTLTLTPNISIRITSPETNNDTTTPLLNLREFPPHLLRGSAHGFNTKDVAFLELLRVSSGFNRTDHSSMRAARDISLNRDALQEGVHKAIIERDHDVLVTLLKIDEYYFRATSSNGEMYTLPAEHYRTCLPNPTTFKLLLRASAESVPPDDSYITAWAMELGDAFGGWLLDLMLRMPEMRDGVRGRPDAGVFWMGRCNAESEMGGRYLRDVLGVQGLEGWMAEGVDFVRMAAS